MAAKTAQAGSGRSKGGLLARAALPPVLPVVAAYRTRAGVVNSTVGWLARAALRAALPASLRGSCGEIPRIERTNRLKPVLISGLSTATNIHKEKKKLNWAFSSTDAGGLEEREGAHTPGQGADRRP